MHSKTNSSESFIEVPASNLESGMYVAGLDRPWLETPFAVQGFYVFTSEDIDFVAQHCAYVFIDPRRRTRTKKVANQAQPRRTYKDSSSLKSELQVVETDLTSASKAMEGVFSQLKTGGHLDIEVVQKAINPLIESVLRNSEAIGALMRMKRKGEYLFNHSLAVAVWAAILGRHLGLERKRLEKLALGAALLDVGMAGVDDAYTQSKDPLAAEEISEIHKHVAFGVDLLTHSNQLPEEVIGMIASHHERHDGSGYPQGLAGMDIPLFGRIAGLVDSYDAMITQRPYARCRSSFEAMQELADLKDQLYLGTLVEQFLQAVGLFPTGSVVMLNTGEVGVVVQQNSARRLRPKIAVVLNADGQKLPSMTVIDLAKYEANHGKTDLWITQELEPGAHGIQPDEYFL